MPDSPRPTWDWPRAWARPFWPCWSGRKSPHRRHGVDFRILHGAGAALQIHRRWDSFRWARYRARFYLARERPGLDRLEQLAKERAASFGIAVGVCVFTMWAAFFFSFGKVPVWNVSLPAWEYFDGIRVALLHNTEGHPAWLLGEARRFGWWYYFPVALAVKTPLALLVLLLVGHRVCWRNRERVAYLMPLAFTLGVLLPAMTGNVNIGVRHVLPVYLAFSVMASLGLVQLARLAIAKLWAGRGGRRR